MVSSSDFLMVSRFFSCSFWFLQTIKLFCWFSWRACAFMV